MSKRRTSIAFAMSLGTLSSLGNLPLWALAPGATPSVLATAAEQTSADPHIVDVTAITNVFADGLKVSAVAVQYDQKVRDSSLKASDYKVVTDAPSQKITAVYTSDDGLQTTRRGVNGRYVILELSTDYTLPAPKHVERTAPPPPPPGHRAEPVKQEVVLNPEVVTTMANVTWDPANHPATLKSTKHGGNGKSVTVEQVGTITAADGTVLGPTTASKDNVYCRNLIVDGFMKPDFTIGTHGNVKYNIHFPSNYDKNKTYPLVVFLSDSDSPGGFTHAEFLVHGQGGTVWAGKEEEARHPAIVLVPALSRSLVDKSGELAVQSRPGGQTSVPYDGILELVESMPKLVPNVDRSRVYITGQGDGARAALRMMEDRPHLFAAALLFAPDYDTARISKLMAEKMWIVVAQNDDASYTSMNAAMASLVAAGAHVNQSKWHEDAPGNELAADVHKMERKGDTIDYAVLEEMSPSDSSKDSAENHARVWRVGYSIPALRDWLFSQRSGAAAESRAMLP